MAGAIWKSVVGALIAAMFIAVALTPDPNARSLSTCTNDELIAMLSTGRTQVRRAVCGQLIARGKTVVPTLLAALPRADDLQRRGLFEVLEELLLSNDLVVAESAESALERLRADQDPVVSGDADQVLGLNSLFRHRRAVAQFSELGGHVEILNSRVLHRQDEGSVLDGLFSEASLPLALVDDHWTGGDQGLKYLARMFPNEMLAVHFTDDAPVTEEAIRRLRTGRERLLVRREHEGCLGVVVNVGSESTQVSVAGVLEHSPAERADIRVGDVILDFNGEPVRRYRDLTRQAANHRAGEFVQLRLQRGNATIRLRLALGSDFRTTRCQCLD
jgi:hypothetical protein